MTDQEAFDAMCRHLLSMKEQAITDEGDCRYRLRGGRRCPVGALIPDDQYHESFEGDAGWQMAGRVPALSGVAPGLLDAVQHVHDVDRYWNSRGVNAEGVAQLRRVANDFNLSPAVLDSPR